MAKFDGFQCDVCKTVWATDQKTREVVRFEGLHQIGTYARELCPDCVVEPIGMTKISRGERSSKPAIPDPPARPIPQRTRITIDSLPEVTLDVEPQAVPEISFPDPMVEDPPAKTNSLPPILGVDYGVKYEG